MPQPSTLSIIIRDKNSTEQLEGGKYDNAKPLILRHAVILEDEHGNTYYANTSGRIIANGLGPATRGAMQRFNDNPDMP